MRISRMPYSIPGQLLTAPLAAVMILGSVGCNGLITNLPPGAAGSTFGLFLNTDTSSDVIGTVRLANGQSVFVFGSFEPDGRVREITGAVLRDDQGQEAEVTFENGLLKSAGSFDGSTLNLTYDEVSTQRLKGRADVFLAQVAPPDQNQTIDFDVDLQQAAADLAQSVADLTGLNVSEAEPPEDPLATTKPRQADPSPAGANKADQSAQVIIFAIFQASAFAAIGFVMVQVMARLVSVMVNLVVGLVVAITRTIVLAVLTPFIIMGDILRVAIVQPIITIDFDLDLDILIPSRPRGHLTP